MAKKKVQKKQSGSKLLVNSILVLVLLVVAIVGGSAAYRYSNSYILTSNGEKVPTAEYLLNLYERKYTFEYYFGTDVWSQTSEDGQSYSEMAYEYSLNQVLSLLATSQKAAEMDITLTEEDDEDVQSYIDQLTESYGETMLTYVGMSDEDLKHMAEKYVLYSKVYDAVIADYEMDEEEAEEAYATYLTDSKQSYMTVYVDYIRVEDDDTAHTVLAELKDGADVVELAEQYSMDYVSVEDQKANAIAAAEATEDDERDEETIAADIAAAEEAEYVNYVNVANAGFSEDLVAAAFDDMAEGDISSIFPEEDGYVVFVIHSIEEPDYDELKEWFMSNRLSSEQTTYMSGIVEEWVDALDYKLNNSLYKKIDITTI